LIRLVAGANVAGNDSVIQTVERVRDVDNGKPTTAAETHLSNYVPGNLRTVTSIVAMMETGRIPALILAPTKAVDTYWTERVL
jgi:hypothetical protein